jgi:hypothetical protein
MQPSLLPLLKKLEPVETPADTENGLAIISFHP